MEETKEATEGTFATRSIVVFICIPPTSTVPSTSTTSNTPVMVKTETQPPPKKAPKSGLERVREWRKRKKQLELQLQQDQSLDLCLPSTSTTASTMTIVNPSVMVKTETQTPPKKAPKSGLERAREWRKRKKQLAVQLQQDQSFDKCIPSTSTAASTRTIGNPPVMVNTETRPSPKKAGKSGLERAREWRKRKKQLEIQLQQDQLLDICIPSTSTTASTKIIGNPPVIVKTETQPPPKKAPKSGLERNREWRERKKQLVKTEMQPPPKKAPKSRLERVREWRERKKQLVKTEIQLPPKKAPKSRLERVREWRERKKQLEAQLQKDQSLDICIPSISTAPLPYAEYNLHRNSHREFERQFSKNNFGSVCYICDRLWFLNDVKKVAAKDASLIHTAFPDADINEIVVCKSCRGSLKNNTIPALSKSNGFVYPEMPTDLPTLDLVMERLISPRLPFMQIRRFRHAYGEDGILVQIINVPVSVNTMVNHLPRNINDDHCINVHIKRKKIHKSSYLMGLVRKRIVKAWLEYLIETPLYRMYQITIDQSFFDGNEIQIKIAKDEISEAIPIEESLVAQQQTLLWSMAPGEKNTPQSLLFEEELSFPSIYLGQFRMFRDNLRVTPFMMATSELRRSDRRGVTPYHLLYVAMKIMRLRTRDSHIAAFKYIGKDAKLSREQVQSKEYINNCIENNLDFLRTIPNSPYYWAQRQRDLFAMIRQLGKPTLFLTLSANEIGWPRLLQTLYKFQKNSFKLSENTATDLDFMQKASLVNEDAVICAIYFNKLVDVIMNILQSKRYSPFGNFYVVNYFKRIEFPHRGSPHAHILLWLNNATKDPFAANNADAIAMIDQLVSISADNASGHIKLQTHKHTFTCYKKIVNDKRQICGFEAPFMPCRSTTILVPMPKTDCRQAKYAAHYKRMWQNLEDNDYADIDAFFKANDINSYEYYLDILRASIKRPKVFLKRQPSEKWHIPFNPFILNIFQSNTDIQFITEEYSCAAYVVEYVNKTNRGISNLQRNIVTIMNEHPEFGIIEITRKLSIDMLNTVEITTQEAAWYLLRQPMSESSVVVVYIPTVWPIERQRVRKSNEEMNEENLADDINDIWKKTWFDKYEKRPQNLEHVTLAYLVANYTCSAKGDYKKRQYRCIIRYRNYDMSQDINEYKREMVTLHMPFRNEEAEILSGMKFVKIYDDNEELILERRKLYESDLDIRKTMEICKEMCNEDDVGDLDKACESYLHNLVTRLREEPDAFEEFYDSLDSEMNADITLSTLNKLGVIEIKHEN